MKLIISMEFDSIYKEAMSKLICEATTEIEASQINTIKRELKNLGIYDKFYVKLPNGKNAGPFNKIRQVSKKSKTCKADAEIYNTKDKSVQSIYISLKDYAFRQFGGKEDLFGGKIYKNMKDEAFDKIIENPFIKSRYNLIVKLFNHIGANKFDFKKLKNKIKGFHIPLFSFKVPKNQIEFFNPCKFGFDMMRESISGINNVDVIIIGEPEVKTVKRNVIDLSVINERGSIEWNTKLYGNTEKNIILDKHAIYLCFMFDENRHTFGEFTNCRFVLWPEYKVLGWIHENDINDYMNQPKTPKTKKK